MPRLIVDQLLTIDGKSDGDLAIQEVRLGKTKHNISLQCADVGLNRQRFSQAEEVVGGVTQTDEGACQSAYAAGKADLIFAFFVDFQSQIDQAIFFVQVALGHIGIIRLQLLEKPSWFSRCKLNFHSCSL